MKLRFLSFILLLFCIDGVSAQTYLEGEAISETTEPLLIELTTELDDADFLLTFKPHSINQVVEIDWDGQTKLQYEVKSAGDLNIKETLQANGALKNIKIYAPTDLLFTLTIQSMKINSIEFKTSMGLGQLRLNDNPKIESIDLTNLPILTTFSCRGDDTNGSELVSLNVSANTLLETLTIPYNTKLSSLNLDNNAALGELTIDEAPLSSPDLLANNASLRKVNMNKCGFSNGVNLANHPSLTELSCTDNQMGSIDLSGCTALISLTCSNNKLESLDLSNSGSLNSLLCSNNELSSLTLAGTLPTMATIQCQYNKLNYATFPRVKATSYNFGNQATLPANLKSDGYTIDINDYVPSITNSDNYPAQTDNPTYTITWYFDYPGNAMTLDFLSTNMAGGVPLYSVTDNKYKFNDTFLNIVTMFAADANVYAEISNTAYNVKLKTESVEVTGKATGIKGEDSADKISVFPNPFAEILFINGTSETCKVDVVNMQGMVVYSTKTGEGVNMLSLGNLSSGIYLVKINDNGKEYIQKVIKQ